MKKLMLLLLFVVSLNAIGQNYSNLVTENFNSIEEYNEAETKILECSDYLLANPVSENEANRRFAFQYLFKWMEGTPDHTFSIGPDAMEITKGNSDLLSLYLAAMVKTTLENTGEKMTSEQLHNAATMLLVDYCADENNGVKPSKAIKKILKKRK